MPAIAQQVPTILAFGLRFHQRSAQVSMPATESRMMERVGTLGLAGEEITRDFVAASVRVWALTGRSAAGFLPRNRRTET